MLVDKNPIVLTGLKFHVQNLNWTLNSPRQLCMYSLSCSLLDSLKKLFSTHLSSYLLHDGYSHPQLMTLPHYWENKWVARSFFLSPPPYLLTTCSVPSAFCSGMKFPFPSNGNCSNYTPGSHALLSFQRLGSSLCWIIKFSFSTGSLPSPSKQATLKYSYLEVTPPPVNIPFPASHCFRENEKKTSHPIKTSIPTIPLSLPLSRSPMSSMTPPNPLAASLLFPS